MSIKADHRDEPVTGVQLANADPPRRVLVLYEQGRNSAAALHQAAELAAAAKATLAVVTLARQDEPNRCCGPSPKATTSRSANKPGLAGGLYYLVARSIDVAAETRLAEQRREEVEELATRHGRPGGKCLMPRATLLCTSSHEDADGLTEVSAEAQFTFLSAPWRHTFNLAFGR